MTPLEGHVVFRYPSRPVIHRCADHFAAFVALTVALGIPVLSSPAAHGAPVESGGAQALSPEYISGVRTLDAEGFLARLANSPTAVLIDARQPDDRKQGHIEGSLSLPDTVTSCAALEAVAPAHHAPILFYCNGIRCGRSARSARIAVDCGYTDIYWLRRGIEEWKAKHYPLVR
jgi:rhodanese-related sulfurtransferase